MSSAVIVDAVRTPLGRRNGRLRSWHPVDLAAPTGDAFVFTGVASVFRRAGFAEVPVSA